MTTYWIFWNDRVVFTGTKNPMPQEVESRKHARYDAADTEEIVYDFNVVSNLSSCSDLIEYLMDNTPNDESMHSMLTQNILFFNAQITTQHLDSSSISSSHSESNSQPDSSESSSEAAAEYSPTSSASPGEASISSDDIPILASTQVGPSPHAVTSLHLAEYIDEYTDDVSPHSTSTISPTETQLYVVGDSETEEQASTSALAGLEATPDYTAWLNFMISMSSTPTAIIGLGLGF